MRSALRAAREFEKRHGVADFERVVEPRLARLGDHARRKIDADQRVDAFAQRGAG